MRYPRDLKKGDTIGFLAPSFGCNVEPYRSAFDHALDRWQEMGYRTVLGPNCYVGEGIGISNTPQKCGAEVMEMFCGREADVLISCGGGELMCEILEYVDFEKLAKAEPKWFMGFSDNTNLVYPLVTLCDTAAVYAPCAAAFGMEPWHPSIRDAYELLTGQKRTVESYPLWEKESLRDEENPLQPYHVTEPLSLKAYVEGQLIMNPEETGASLKVTGRLLGGCMDCLVNLLGTKFDRTAEFCEKYQEDGILWMLEACDLNVMAIRRAMWQMEQAGWFRHVRGFLFGRALNGGPMMDLDVYHAVLAVAAKYNVPVIMDLDIGHLSPMMPLVVGSVATVTLQGNHVSVEMEYKP
ncbi:MAG: LD-carboxypeptidase [Acetatifactor sp.]|nr:LD-carboxypeptidase [Acetatifactor sp.]